MTSENESLSGIISDHQYSIEEKSKDTTEGSISKDRVRKRLKTKSAMNTDSDGDLLQSAGEREITETEDYGTESRSKKRRTRIKRAREEAQGYLDIEADLDADDDMEKGYSGAEAEISREEHDRYMQQILSRRNKNQQYFERFQNPEEIGKFYEDSHTEDNIDMTEFDDADNRLLPLIPSLKDAKLFSVKCRGGSERELAISLMNKYLHLQGTKDEINIFSASALDKFPCHIFIEAHRAFHVKHAIKGLKTVNINTVKIIPVKEVTQVFSPDPTKQPNLEVGQFCRLKKGIYAGDLVMVVDFDDNHNRIKLKLVPRLVSGNMAEDSNTYNKENGVKKTKMRPPRKFFNPEEFPEAKSIIDGKRREAQVYAYDGKRFENGLLVKTMWLKNLITENIVPTLEEVDMFSKSQSTKEGREQIMARAKLAIEESKKFSKNLEKGDKVQIIQGDLKGLTGIVTEVTEGHVKVLPDVEIMNEPVLYMPNEIVKVFNNGDHVQILSGKNKGITGTIIKVDENVAYVISENNKEEMQVLLSDIKYTSNVIVAHRGNTMKASEISKHDLVILNDNRTVGIIISVLMNSVNILDTEGYIKNIKKLQILNKLNPKAHVKNSYGQDLYANCCIRISEGAYKDRSAVVKHVYNNKLFLFDRTTTENSGIIVEHMNNCYLLGTSNFDNTKMLARFNNPILEKNQHDMMLSTEMSHPLEEKAVQPRRQDPKSRRISLIGKTKTITKGAYKGYVGMIQSLNANKVIIELQAKNKSITVPLSYLNLDISERDNYSTNRMTGKTPMYKGANSPFYINTPAYNPE